MNRCIVSDTTALIVLGKLERGDLLAGCFETVMIPSAVREELTAKEDAVWRHIGALKCVETVSPLNRRMVETLSGILDAGESEAIALAKERKLPLLIDEKKGRFIARQNGIGVIGLVGLVLLAVRKGLLSAEEAETFMKDARKTGFYLSDKLAKQFIKQLSYIDPDKTKY